jgi:hypothetical protein
VGVEVIFRCDGCHKEEIGTAPLRREFRSLSGRSWGIGGSVKVNPVENVTPEGWVAYDPYTYCTYCPECWKSIIEGGGKDGK